MVQPEKNDIQFPTRMRCSISMNKNGHPSRQRRVVDYATTAVEQMKHYCTAHPGSPSAVALLGVNLAEGIVGIGPTVEAALRAFDTQYLNGLRPPNEGTSYSVKPRRSFRSAFTSARGS
jgi:hypothetical protein